MNVGRDHLDAILKVAAPGAEFWNEAQNRFAFVDRLLLECLGWEHPYIDVETRDEAGGKADYVLGKPVRAVLEAKREAVRFDFLPAAKPNALRKLRPLTESCKNLNSAITQVIPYCAFHGAQIAIVCNGPQLVLFQANISGMSPLDGECYVFDGLESYKTSFSLLWKILSPEGILENRALRELTLNRNPRIPPKAYTGITQPMAYRYRSTFQENLRNIASVLLDDIEEKPDVKSAFYKECYVELDANNRHLLLSKNIIAGRYKRVADSGIAPAKVTTSVSAGRVVIDNSTVPVSSGPVVIIGDVGVGKTSFFEYLYEEIKNSGNRSTIFMHIDLGERATLSKDIRTYALQAIPDILKVKYDININSNVFFEKAYEHEINDFDESIEGQLKNIDQAAYNKAKIEFGKKEIEKTDVYLLNALKYISISMNRQIILVMDNATNAASRHSRTPSLLRKR